MKFHRPDRMLRSLLNSLVVVGLFAACGGADDKFAAETYDEYTEPLTDAVIGTPTGIITIAPATPTPGEGPGAAGSSGTAGGSGTDGGPGSAGRAGAEGIGGSFGGAAGSSELGGSGGTGGIVGSGGAGGIVGPGGSAGRAGVADGGVGGSTGGDGSGSGFWHFDDCSPSSHFLTDSSGLGANAQHALNGSCVPGISGLGVQIRSARDIVQVPDEPQFTVGQRVAVAAWVHPSTVGGNQPIVIKRLNKQTSFSLGIHDGNIEMSVVLSTGKTVISRAPLQAGVWSHVAGMFDGTFVFLFINGQQFGQIFAAGTLRNVFAPIRIGATTQAQFFDGIIDDVFLSTDVVSKEQLAGLSCVQNPSTIAVTPATSGVVPPGTTVHYDIAVTDNDLGFCAPANYRFFINGSDPGFFIDPQFNFATADPGTTVTFGTNVTSSDDAEPGLHTFVFSVQNSVFPPPPAFPKFEFLQGQLVYEMAEPTGCFVRSSRELMIKHLSVVDDPVRTSGNGTGVGGGGGSGGGVGTPPDGPRPPSVDGGSVVGDAATSTAEAAPAPRPGDVADESSRGVWSFGHLMRELAPTPEQAPAMAEQVFRSFLTDQTVNGFTVQARPAMQPVVLDNWPRTANGALDLDRAPVTLQAIVNRIDVRDLSVGSGGEGRFVFGVNSAFGALEFTIIFEYNLPARTEQDVLEWANLWHGLSSHPFPSEEYNAALEAITRRFSGRNASPGSVNGSALLSFRTNEIALSFQWELRQFELSPETGFFRQIPLSETPDFSFNGTQAFADNVNQNAAAIIALVPGGTGNTVPLQFEGMNFQAGSVFNNLNVWFAPGIRDPEARFHASMNTCNGCHGPETGSSFLQISPRGVFNPGGEAVLSPFITGTTVVDQFSGQVRTLNDLKRRKDDLTSLVCPTDPDAGVPDAVSPPPPPDATRPPPPPTRDAGPGL